MSQVRLLSLDTRSLGAQPRDAARKGVMQRCRAAARRGLGTALWLLCVGLIGAGLAAPRRAWAGDVRVLVEGLSTEKLPFLKMYVTLTEPSGKVVRAKSGYKLFLDTVEQKGLQTEFTPIVDLKEPMDIIAVVQVSQTMEPALKGVQAGIEKLAKALAKAHPENRLGLISYASEVKRLEDPGPPKGIARELDKLVIDAEGTEIRLIDALRTAIDVARERTDRRRHIILFSDGIESVQSKESFGDVTRKAKLAGVAVDLIAFTPIEAGRVRPAIELAKATGGSARPCKKPEDASASYADLWETLQSGGMLSFGLTTSGDGAEHAIQIGYKQGGEDILSDSFPVTLPAFEPAETAGRGWMFWLGVVAGGLVGLLILLYIIGRILQK